MSVETNNTHTNNAASCEFTQAVAFICCRMIAVSQRRFPPASIEDAAGMYPDLFFAINNPDLPNNLSFTDALKAAGVLLASDEEQTEAA